MSPAVDPHLAADSESGPVDADLELQEPVIEVDLAAGRSGGGWLKVALPLAAALLLGVGGAVYYFPGAGEAETHGVSSTVPVTGNPVPPPVNAGTAATTTTTPPADLLAEAREAFRAKLQLAVRLGLGGEGHR